jgi:transposase-like protein
MSVSLVARRHGIAPNQLFTWRRLYASGALSAVGAGEEVVVAASEYRALQHQVGATTRKCSECATSWTKQKRTARWYVRCTLDGCRSGGGRRHVSDVPDSDTRSRLKCAPTVTPLGFPYRIKSLFSVASRAPAVLSCSTRRVAASDVVRVHRMLPDRRDFELCCPVLRRYFGEARPVATTIEAGLIDGRAKITIEVSA